MIINQGQTTECDITSTAQDGSIFKMDANGNVLIVSNPPTTNPSNCFGSSGGGTGGTLVPTFTPLNPIPLTINGGSGTSSIAAGTNPSLTYTAYNASSCSVGIGSTVVANPSGSSCPAASTLSVSNSGAACTGTLSSPSSCTPPGGTVVNVPASLPSGTTSCAYSLTASCQPTGGDTSANTLTVLGSGSSPPPGCGSLATIGLSRESQGQIVFALGYSATTVDLTQYINMYNDPTLQTKTPWPGTSNIKPTVKIGTNAYVALGFTTPASGSVAPFYAEWVNNQSGTYNVSISVSTCPGDFGQSGTQISDLTKCRGDLSQVWSSFGGYSSSMCQLSPNTQYYLNMVFAHLPSANQTTALPTICNTSSCSQSVAVFNNYPF